MLPLVSGHRDATLTLEDTLTTFTLKALASWMEVCLWLFVNRVDLIVSRLLVPLHMSFPLFSCVLPQLSHFVLKELVKLHRKFIKHDISDIDGTVIRSFEVAPNHLTEPRPHTPSL